MARRLAAWWWVWAHGRTTITNMHATDIQLYTQPNTIKSTEPPPSIHHILCHHGPSVHCGICCQVLVLDRSHVWYCLLS